MSLLPIRITELRRSAALYTLGGLLIGLALGLGIFLAVPMRQATGSSGPQTYGGALQGDQAPEFSLEDTLGTRHNLADYRGQVVLLNFWATWCAPCKLEMPAIQERYDDHQGQGFQVLAVDFDESSSTVKAFADELNLTFPLLLDPGGEVQKQYRIRGYPTSVFLDRDGVVRNVYVGIMTERQLDQALSELGVGPG